jgi:hypothetical protein
MQSSSEKWKDVPSVEAVENEQDLRRKESIARERSRASLARRMRQAFSQSTAQYLMRFQDFQNPKRRNKILRDYGLDPIHLPFDPVQLRRPRKPRNRPNKGRSQ